MCPSVRGHPVMGLRQMLKSFPRGGRVVPKLDVATVPQFAGEIFLRTQFEVAELWFFWPL